MALQTRVEKIIKPALVSTPGKNGLLQRKCSRCNTNDVDNEHEDDQKKHLVLQRRAASEGDLTGVPPIVHDVLRSSGEPLDSETRAFMEPRFGHDFSKVRIHTDEKAADSAKAVNALAYAVGQNIVFGEGQYTAGKASGQQLLIHELVHVTQQEKGGEHLQRAPKDGKASDTDEVMARNVASAIAKTYQFSVEGKTFTLTESEFNREKARINRKLELDFKLLEEEVIFNKQQHQEFLDKVHGWAGIISDILGDTVPPDIGIWSWSVSPIKSGRKALQSGNLEQAGRQLKLAQGSFHDAQREWNVYIDKTTGGAQKAVTALEYTRDTSFAIAIGTAAVVAAPVVAGALAGGGAITAGTTLGTGAIVTAGGGMTGAVLRGGSSAAGQALAGGSVSGSKVWKEMKEGAKRGTVDAATSVVGLGAGKALGLGAESVSLGGKIVRGGLAGGASGATGGALESTLEGKSASEILEDTGKGLLSGIAGGTVGSAASHMSAGRSTLTKYVAETLGEAGSGAASAAVTGGSPEDIKKAVITSVVSGRVTSAATHPGIKESKKAKSAPEPDLGSEPEHPVKHRELELQTNLSKDSGLELDFDPQPQRPVPYRELETQIDLSKDSGLELDFDPQPQRPVPYRELEPQVSSSVKFGEPSSEKAGTEHRKGMHFHEFNAAEIDHGLRIDWDPIAGRPRKVTYTVDADVPSRSKESDRSFSRDISIEGAQPREKSFEKSGYEKSHLAQREAFKGSKEAERAADLMTNVVPMTPKLNRLKGSLWRTAEKRTIDYVTKKGYQSVIVEIEPIYDAKPKRLSDGTPIPKAISRRVSTIDGQELEYITYLNN